MAGHFELLSDRQSHIRFRLIAPDGASLAVSGPFDDKNAAAEAISAVRGCAGTGLIEDHCIVGTQNTLHDPEPEMLDGFDLKSEHVGEVLAELAGFAEATLSPARPGASFGITIIRAKKPPASAGRGVLALRLNELQDSLGEGPGMTAMAEKRTVLCPRSGR
ncbi:YegP family protein [Arthrobacter nitrophenolicus]|uniref:DUF1508 domain-containing protein n=1 Tax=Arthrobacter nitrophenolicus TaxID=683150 RepID=A0A4R5Y1M0_9MICC|nr:YegP family protein [Arthrobacter nitrophenolicus]TDL37357.1 DUF1508 domain-containing protein [Arthrobacter nitrophenolicus]